MQRSEKITAIAKHTYEAAQIIANNVVALYGVKRKLPRFKSKNTTYRARSLRKRRIGPLTASLAISQAMAAAQLQIILSRPTPKFKSGSAPAIINETGKETFEGLQPNS